MRLFHLLTGRNHTLYKMIDHLVKGCFQLLIAAVGIQTTQIRTELLSAEQAFPVMQCQLQHLIQIKHCCIAPAQIISLRCQLDTANNGIIHSILMRNAQLFHFGNNRLIVKELRHTASLCHNAHRLL